MRHSARVVRLRNNTYDYTIVTTLLQGFDASNAKEKFIYFPEFAGYPPKHGVNDHALSQIVEFGKNTREDDRLDTGRHHSKSSDK